MERTDNRPTNRSAVNNKWLNTLFKALRYDSPWSYAVDRITIAASAAFVCLSPDRGVCIVFGIILCAAILNMLSGRWFLHMKKKHEQRG